MRSLGAGFAMSADHGSAAQQACPDPGVNAGCIQVEGQDRFLNGMQAKYRAAAAQGKNYVQALVSKVKF